MSWKDALTKLFAEHEGDLDADEFADALNEVKHSAFQTIWDKGFATAKKRAEDDAAKLEADLKAERAKVDGLREKVKELEDKSPDAAKLHEQYRQQLAEQKEEFESKLAERDRTMAEERRQRARSDLVARLAKRLDADFAEVQADRHMDRIRHGDDGSLEVLKAGSEIPLQAGGDKSPLDVLADEIYEGAAPKWRTSDGDRGAGTQSGGASGSGGYDPVADGKKMAEEQKGTDRELAFK